MLVVDRAGQLRFSHFRRIDDIALGALLGRLLTQEQPDDMPSG